MDTKDWIRDAQSNVFEGAMRVCMPEDAAGLVSQPATPTKAVPDGDDTCPAAHAECEGVRNVIAILIIGAVLCSPTTLKNTRVPVVTQSSLEQSRLNGCVTNRECTCVISSD